MEVLTIHISTNCINLVVGLFWTHFHSFEDLSGECNMNRLIFSKVRGHKIGTFGHLIDP